MIRHAIPYRDTARFSAIVMGYLDGTDALRELYVHRPDRKGVEAAAQRAYDPSIRAVLSDVLEDQYAGMAVDPAVRHNLTALRQQGTMTVTTGHQLCLFTGPLYVPFKVLNVIRLAREFSTPSRPVVPVFWMATEDHDRKEIDHAWINGTQVEWPGSGSGAVGGMVLEGITKVLDEVEAALGDGPHREEALALLRACYQESATLAQATRRLLNALFGRYGLVVLDGDDPRIKRVFAPAMQEELLNEVTIRSVAYANDRMGSHAPQAHAREINLFHLSPGRRSRIERSGDRYRVLDGGPEFDLDGLLAELGAHPEKFSPNVLLRPLYQETILPNIAYVGGGGEIAYWLQLRWLFQALRVPMPVLLLRTSAAILRGKDMAQWRELGLDPADLFADPDAVRGRVAAARSAFSTDLSSEREQLRILFDRIAGRVKAADATLEGAARSAEQRTMKAVSHLEDKLLRSAKRQQETDLKRVDGILGRLFPGGVLQERQENFLTWYASAGAAFFDELIASLDPLDPVFSVLEE